MEIKIFYSWQSDLPNNTNRGFIQKALENAVRNIYKDESIEVVPSIDKDTQGVSGSPNIPETILQKINECDFFVCDVSIINNGSKFRPTPNPNVLFELGYALKKFGWNQVIMVCNQTFGDLSKLPFDLDKRRVVLYTASEKDADRSSERKKLEGILESHLRSFIETVNLSNTIIEKPAEEIPLNQRAIQSIKKNEPHALNTIKEYFGIFCEDLGKFDISNPDDITTDLIIERIADTKEVRDEIVEVIEAICRYSSDPEYFTSIHKFFESLIPYLEPARNLGRSHAWQADHYKFLIREMFLYAVASLINHRKFQQLNELIVQGYFVSGNFYRLKSGLNSFTIFDAYSDALRFYNDQLNPKWNSIHGYFTHERADRTDIKFDDLMQADFFLYIFNGLQDKPKGEHWTTKWFPTTLPYAERMDSPFEVFARAESKSFFEKLKVALMDKNKEDLENLAKEVDEGRTNLKWGFFAPRLAFYLGLERIATKP